MESLEVEAKSKVVRVDEEAATVKANEAKALKDDCESNLAAAIPALEAALSALDTLKVSNPVTTQLLYTSVSHVHKCNFSSWFPISHLTSRL